MKRFKKGDVLVCIDDSPPLFARDAPRLVLGEIYEATMDGGYNSIRVTQRVRCCLAHKELMPTDNMMDFPWRADRFEKVGSIR